MYYLRGIKSTEKCLFFKKKIDATFFFFFFAIMTGYLCKFFCMMLSVLEVCKSLLVGAAVQVLFEMSQSKRLS